MNSNSTSHFDTISKKSWGFIALMFLALCAINLTLILTAVENVSWSEELAIGTIAKEIMRGNPLGLHLYQWDDYAGESLWLGGLTSVWFHLFGDSLFALKLTPLFSQIGTWVLTFFFIYRYFGLKAAFATALLRLALPPLFARYGLIVLGGHSEGLFFNILVFITFYALMFNLREGGTKALPRLIIWALISGVSCWYHPLISITVLCCLMTWLTTRVSCSLKNILIWTLIFFTGFFPWIFHNASAQSQTWAFLWSIFHTNPGFEINQIIHRLYRITTHLLPQLFSYPFPQEAHHLWYRYVYFALFTLLFGWSCKQFITDHGCAPHRLPRKQWPILLYPILFLTLYAVSDLPLLIYSHPGEIDFRYFTFFYFAACMIIGIAVSRKKTPKWILISYFIFLIFGIIGQYALAFKEPFGNAFAFKGYSYHQHIFKWNKTPVNEIVCSAKSTDDLIKRTEEGLASLEWPQSYFRLYGLWTYCEYSFNDFKYDPNTEDADLKQSIATAEKKFPGSKFGWIYDQIGQASAVRRRHDWSRLPRWLPESIKPNFHNGFFRLPMKWSANPETVKLLERIEMLPQEAQPFAAWNIGKSMSPQDLKWRDSEQLKASAADNKRAFYRGVGFALIPTPHPAFALEHFPLITLLPHEYGPDILEGMGWRIREHLIEDRQRGLAIINRFPHAYLPDLMRGFENCEKWYRIPDVAVSKGLLRSLKEA